MRKKLLITYSILILIAIGTSFFAYSQTSYNYLVSQTKENNLQIVRLLREIFESSDNQTTETRKDFVKKFSAEYNIRITLIGQNGEVLADSLGGLLGNHSNREEVEQALQGEEAIVERYSTTLHVDCMYVAVPVASSSFSGVLRVCIPLENVKVLEEKIVSLVWFSICLGLAIATIGAFVFSRLISKPIEDVTKAAQSISEGRYDTKIYTRERTQIGELAKSFNMMSSNMKDAIETLTQRKSELEAILGSIGAGVVAIDGSGKILFVNQEFLTMLNAKTRYTEGRDLHNIVREAAIFQVIDEVKRKNERVRLASEIYNPKEIKIQIVGSPLVTEDRNTFGVLLIINDITHIHKLESMRRDFVSNVTHELKTPLTSIHGFVDTLRHGAIEDKNVAQHFLEIIDIETERLSSLINDILTLSEIETKRDYHCEPYHMENGIKSVVELLQCHIGEEVSLTYDCEPNLPVINCNPARMQQLLINLIENALKYTEVGTVHVEAYKEAEHLVIQIEDTGIGIPKDQIERIFERFYRVDKSRSRRQGGTGLGLSIVKHILELYNGSIYVESEVNKGSIFTVKFPLNHTNK